MQHLPFLNIYNTPGETVTAECFVSILPTFKASAHHLLLSMEASFVRPAELGVFVDDCPVPIQEVSFHTGDNLNRSQNHGNYNADIFYSRHVSLQRAAIQSVYDNNSIALRFRY